MEAYESYQEVTLTDAEFQKLAQTVGTNVQKILQNVTSIQRMVVQIGTVADNPAFQQQLHQIQHYTGQLAKDTSKHLRELNNAASTDDRQWRLQKERLHNDFTKALNSFQAAQRTAAQREKEAVKRAKAGSKKSIEGHSLMEMNEASVGEQRRTQQMITEEEANLEQLEERERSIRQLESDIVDVNTIFKDLATMVHEQGELVDSIEANVESTHVRVSEGTDQLRQAEQYKNTRRKREYTLLGILLFVFIVLVFTLWVTS